MRIALLKSKCDFKSQCKQCTIDVLYMHIQLDDVHIF
jgi:hypothetical protein